MMQNIPDILWALYYATFAIGGILLFIGSEVIDETIKTKESGSFAQKMQTLFLEKKTTWYILGFGSFVIAWILIEIGAYTAGQMVLLRYPTLVAETIALLLFPVLLALLTIRSKVRGVSNYMKKGSSK